MKKLILFLVMMLSAVGMKAGEPDTLWTRKLPSGNDGPMLLKFYDNETKVLAATPGGRVFFINAENGSILDSMKILNVNDGVYPVSAYDYTNYKGKNLLMALSGDSAIIYNLDLRKTEKIIKDTTLSRNWDISAYKGSLSGISGKFAIEFRTHNDFGYKDTFSVHVYNLENYEISKSILMKSTFAYSSLKFSENGEYLIAYWVYSEYPKNNYANLNYEIFETKSFKKLRTIVHDSVKGTYNFIISPDSKYLLSYSLDGTDEYIRIWDTETKELKYKFTTKKDEFIYKIFSSAFSNDSRKLYIGNFIQDDQKKDTYHLIFYNLETNSFNFLCDSLLKYLGTPKFLQLNRSNTKLLAGISKIFLLDISNINSINSLFQKEDTLYPNPLSNNITINGLDYYDVDKIIFLDIMGNQVKELTSNELIIINNRMTINCGDLPAGTYFLVINSKNLKKTYKIIKEQ